jgi:hypothetical protein
VILGNAGGLGFAFKYLLKYNLGTRQKIRADIATGLSPFFSRGAWESLPARLHPLGKGPGGRRILSA